jgi:hypothetical protein
VEDKLHSGVRDEQWPKDVYSISFDDLGKLGVNYKTKKLYWDGKAVKTTIQLGASERTIAIVGIALVFAQALHPWLVSYGIVPAG